MSLIGFKDMRHSRVVLDLHDKTFCEFFEHAGSNLKCSTRSMFLWGPDNGTKII